MTGPAVGIGWRPPIELVVERLAGVEFVEAIAVGIAPRALPDSLRALRSRGIPVVPHGVSLSLGGAARPDPARLAHLAACALALDSPLVSDHIAFVRSGAREAGHLLPVPRTRAALDVVVANVRIAQDQLPVPLALENIAAVVDWPDDELTEAQFLAEVLDRTGALLLLDVANLFASSVNFGVDPLAVLDELPLTRIGYMHVAGGVLIDGVWHDTHTHPVTEPILALLRELAARTALPAVMLERDGDCPAPVELSGELAAIRAAVGRADDDTPGHMTLPASVAVAEPMPDPPRDLLALRQDDLAAALDGRGGAPASFDQDKVAVARTALVRKRSRAVGRRAPAIAESLGPLLAGLFAEYAAAVPKPPGDDTADVAGFLDHLRDRGILRGTRRRPRLITRT